MRQFTLTAISSALLLAATMTSASCPVSKLQPQYFEGPQQYQGKQANYTWFLSPCGPSVPAAQQSCQQFGGVSGQLGQFDPMGGQCQMLMNQTQPWGKLAASQGDGFYTNFATPDNKKNVFITVYCGPDVGVKLLTPVEVSSGSQPGSLYYSMILSTSAVCGEILPPSPPEPINTTTCPNNVPVAGIISQSIRNEIVQSATGEAKNYSVYLNPCAEGHPASTRGLVRCQTPSEGYLAVHEEELDGGRCVVMMNKVVSYWRRLAGSQGDGYNAIFSNEKGDIQANVIVHCDKKAGNLKSHPQYDPSTYSKGLFEINLFSEHACEPSTNNPEAKLV